MSRRPPPIARAVVSGGTRVCLYAAGRAEVLSPAAAAARLAEVAERFVVWSATRDLAGVVAAGARPARVFDLAEAHRIVHGGWRADPGRVWADAHGLDREAVPDAPADDLFAALIPAPGEEDVLTPEGYLRPDAVSGDWASTEDRLAAWARAALETATRLQAQLARISPRTGALAASESAAAVLCLELERDGLPIDRARAEELIALAAGPRPRDEAEARAIRARRDSRVLAHAPGREHTDLRNPASVKALLAAVGIDVPTTRRWVLESHRQAHPLVPALLDWRRDERIATTYGYGWLAAHVGPDDRLRGGWTACDGAAGRMTAQNGLHNLPVPMRAAVSASPGWVFVRADLGQIEPRVLAVVSADPALAEATASADLYAPVAVRLGVERAVAKVAVLAAMYGQRSGAAGRALAGLERAYPVAMEFLDSAYAAGVAGEDLRTFGGRRIRTRGIRDEGSRGRFARNALIQGAAAELFKCWAATVRAGLSGRAAHIALCLHDELLVHTPAGDAEHVAHLIESALADAARRWSGAAPVRFVADTSVITRWSQAK